MELINQIIYLDRVKSALADMLVLAEHPEFTAPARTALAALATMAETLDAAIRAHPDVQPFVMFMQEGPDEAE